MIARPLPLAAWEDVATVLNHQEKALFRHMSFNDQWHSYYVMQTLRAAGYSHPSLLAAALLHDVGKTKLPLSLWDRTLIVLAQAVIPGRAACWGQAEACGWRRPFVVKARHPEWGAEMAEMAGSQPLTVTLIRHHQEVLRAVSTAEEEDLLRALQWADDQN